MMSVCGISACIGICTAWYGRRIKILEACHIHCMNSILSICWWHRITSAETRNVALESWVMTEAWWPWVCRFNRCSSCDTDLLFLLMNYLPVCLLTRLCSFACVVITAYCLFCPCRYKWLLCATTSLTVTDDKYLYVAGLCLAIHHRQPVLFVT